MNLTDIMDVTQLDHLVDAHYITRRADPTGRFTLHNYTEKATYDRVWTPETRQCRGIVSTDDGTIVARPFDKFFNVDESEETRIDALLARGGAIEITDKLDGSMVAVWYADWEWHTSTRGSFTSSQAIAALQWLRTEHIELPELLQGTTLLCEWCAPDNRVVLRYDKPELIIIGAREANGFDYPHAGLENIARALGMGTTPRQTEALDAFVSRRTSIIGCEGWVARWPDGFRVKIKTEDYLRLHRLVSGFSAARVRDVLLASGDAWASYLTDLPEEFRSEAERMAFAMQQATATRLEGLHATFTRLSPLATESRKAYALAVLQENTLDRPYLFSLMDGKPIADKVLAALDLTALGFEEVEEVAL